MVSFAGVELSAKPSPPASVDKARWAETARRKDILDGRWAMQLEHWRSRALGTTRASLMGEVDLSRNFYRSLTGGLSSLYLSRPTVSHPSGKIPEFLGEDLIVDGEPVRRPGAIEEAGLWAQMAQVQQYTIGLGEMCVMPMVVGLDEDDPRLVYRVVSPDCIVTVAHPDDPTRVVALRELVARVHPTSPGKGLWTWSEWSVADPANPTFRVVEVTDQGHDGQDLTEHYMGGPQSGDAYWWRTAEGRPVIPWVTYHREWASTQWDPYRWREAVDGTLRIAVNWDFWGHCLREASWPARWTAGGRIVPNEIIEGDSTTARHHVIADPTIITRIEQDEQANAVTVGQWMPGANPKELGEAIASDEARLANQMGVDASDLVRTSGDPRSGYALKITNERRREAQAQFGPQFMRADLQLIALSALVVNRAMGTALPESGYQIRYAPVVLDGEDGKAAPANGPELQTLLESTAAGKLPKASAEALIRHGYGLSAEAAAELVGPLEGFTPAAPAMPPAFGRPPMAPPMDDPENEEE
jgi:hypothetical protein